MADPQAKRKQTAEDKLDNIYAVNFTKRQLIFLNNVLLGKEYRVGDVLGLLPILELIRPFIVDVMQPPPGPTPSPVAQGEPNHVLTSTKKESN